MARNGNAPRGAGQAPPTRGVAAGQPGRHLRRRPDRVPAVPELAAAGRLHHLGHRAVLRAPARSCWPRCAASCPTTSGRSGCPAATSSRSSRSGRSNLIVYWSGWTTDWKLFVAVLHRLRAARRLRSSPDRRPAAARPARPGRLGAAVAGRPDARVAGSATTTADAASSASAPRSRCSSSSRSPSTSWPTGCGCPTTRPAPTSRRRLARPPWRSTSCRAADGPAPPRRRPTAPAVPSSVRTVGRRSPSRLAYRAASSVRRPPAVAPPAGAPRSAPPWAPRRGRARTTPGRRWHTPAPRCRTRRPRSR